MPAAFGRACFREAVLAGSYSHNPTFLSEKTESLWLAPTFAGVVPANMQSGTHSVVHSRQTRITALLDEAAQQVCALVSEPLLAGRSSLGRCQDFEVGLHCQCRDPCIRRRGR